LNTGVFKLNATYFHRSGFYAELAVSDVAQKVESILPSTGTRGEKDSFWISDAILGYRFPKRHGLIKLQIKNLFDKEFRYQSTFPGIGTQIYSPYTPERSLYLYLKIWI
jgi:outer membrane receptor protein involved in Fe transport